MRRMVLTIGIVRRNLAGSAKKGPMPPKPKRIAEGESSDEGRLSFLVGPHLLKGMSKAAAQASRSLYQGKKALPWWIKRVLANALQTDEGIINPKGYPELEDERTENVKLRVSPLFHDACVEAAERSGCSLTEWILVQCLKAMDAQESETRNRKA